MPGRLVRRILLAAGLLCIILLVGTAGFVQHVSVRPGAKRDCRS
jgi:hypothetical protein